MTIATSPANVAGVVRGGLLTVALSLASCFNPGDSPPLEGSTGQASTGSGTTALTAQASTSGSSSTGSAVSSTSTTASETTAPATTGPLGTSSTTGRTTSGGRESTGGSTESSTTGPVSCSPSLDECGAGQYCDAVDCNTTGTCVDRPPSTDVAYVPACGCNGTSYWNVQHANWLGVTAESAPNGCAELNCFSDADCAPGTTCTIDHGPGPGGCGEMVEGQCFGIPSDASCEGEPAGSVGFGACDGGPFICNEDFLTLCEALLAEEFFVVCI